LHRDVAVLRQKVHDAVHRLPTQIQKPCDPADRHAGLGLDDLDDAQLGV
jgi:hypothetical protein